VFETNAYHKDTDPQFNILVITDNIDASRSLNESFERRGQKLHFSTYNGLALTDGFDDIRPDGILILLTDYIEHSENILTILDEKLSHISIPKLGVLFRHSRDNEDTLFDSVIYAPTHPEQIAQRMTSVLRLQRIEREIDDRILTYREDFGITCDYNLKDVDRPFNILFFGKASPSFLSMINALQGDVVNITGAFSSFSAFSYLHEKTYNAIVINASEDIQSALTVIKTMRRNSRLYNIPVILLVKNIPTDKKAIYNQGVHDLILVDASDYELRGRIIEAAKFHRLHQFMQNTIKRLKFDVCLDPPTGLFNKAFFVKHLKRVVDYSKANQSELSLVLLQIQPNSVHDVDPLNILKAENQIGSMLTSLTRSQDIAARIDNNRFAILFPEQNVNLLDSVIARIYGIIDCTAFESGNTNEPSPFTMSVEAIKVPLMHHETAEQFLQTALSELVGDVYVSNPIYKLDAAS